MWKIYSKGSGKHPLPKWVEHTEPIADFEEAMYLLLTWKHMGQRVRLDWVRDDDED